MNSKKNSKLKLKHVTSDVLEHDEDEGPLMQVITLKIKNIDYQFFGPAFMECLDTEDMMEISFNTNLLLMTDVIEHLINMHENQEQIRERLQ